MGAEDRARLEAMTDEEITAAEPSDLDKPPLTDQEIARRARDGASLTQAALAEAFAVNLCRRRNIKPGRKIIDRVLVAFLSLVVGDPERTRRVVGETL